MHFTGLIYYNHNGILNMEVIWLILFIVFAETGLFMGFFFPGDSLLFVAGICEWHPIQWRGEKSGLDFQFLKLLGINYGYSPLIDLFVSVALIGFCGVPGNAVGYWTGRKVGPTMYKWKDRFLFKKQYLHQAKEFYEKYGGGAIFMARFVPFVRTFAPIVAGIVQMDKKEIYFFSHIMCVCLGF